MKQEIIDKYNVPVPRYTSYPPANYFKDKTNQKDYIKAIWQSNSQKPEAISFYIHIPFCLKLCHYCGCNSIACPEPEIIDRYIAALHKEMDIIIPLLNPKRKISQIHYGGGTPNIIPAYELESLNRHLLAPFDTIDNPEIAIECHPGWMEENAWMKLTEAGFNRVSIGIQDFNNKVLKAVHREAPLIPIEKAIATLRSGGARINMDFLYGLPYQTEASFAETIEKAVSLQPDRIVTFSYAHLPQIFNRQKMLEKAGLPSAEEKSRMFEAARKIFLEADYKQIGMDHFVTGDDDLYRALAKGQLHRNFQGYCTRQTTGQVYAFGVSGISQLGTAYAQNTKDIMKYIEKVEAGVLPTVKYYQLNREKQITREVIEALMCNYHIKWEDLSERLAFPIEEIKQATAYDEARLQEFADDGIIEYDNDQIWVTPEGKPFVRNVAASLDKLMLDTNKSFSKPI